MGPRLQYCNSLMKPELQNYRPGPNTRQNCGGEPERKLLRGSYGERCHKSNSIRAPGGGLSDEAREWTLGANELQQPAAAYADSTGDIGKPLERAAAWVHVRRFGGRDAGHD